MWYIPCLDKHQQRALDGKNYCQGITVNPVGTLMVFGHKEDMLNFKKQYKEIHGKVPLFREGEIIINK